MRQTIAILAGAMALGLSLSCNAHGQPSDEFSPRGFCKTTGGEVSETGRQGVYICCYPAKRKCLMSNIEAGYSRVIAPRGDRTATLHARNTRGGYDELPCR